MEKIMNTETENTINIKPSDKLLNLPKYIFAELNEWKDEARANGIDLIDLSIGNPDGETPKPVVEAALKSIVKPESHGYPSFRGKIEFRKAIADWMKRRYNVTVDPVDEIQTLIGEKEGLANVAMAFTNPGDINIVPDPYYPVLSRGTWIASGKTFHIQLKKENGFLPDLDEIPEDIARKAKIFFINYPNTPTAAIAPIEFLEKLVDFCRKYSILLVSDMAYGEVVFDKYRPNSIFEIEGARDVAVEFHSFSKTFNMAGWRAGFAVGKKEFIDVIYGMKSNIDYGTSTLVQDAAIEALTMPYEYVQEIMDKYDARRELIARRLTKLGWDVYRTPATMYFWLKIPGWKSKNMTSKKWCKMVLDKTGIVFTPGVAFGDMSDDHFRLSIVQPSHRLDEAFDRMEKEGIVYED